jgi:hypothetical protein
MLQFGGFIPTVYKIKIETEAGSLDMTAHAANARPWGVTGKCPDNPVATLQWDTVDGIFTDPNGKIKKLHNGYGYMSIRQCRAYPSIIPPIDMNTVIKK